MKIQYQSDWVSSFVGIVYTVEETLSRHNPNKIIIKTKIILSFDKM
jgi:hypothetical protein